MNLPQGNNWGIISLGPISRNGITVPDTLGQSAPQEDYSAGEFKLVRSPEHGRRWEGEVGGSGPWESGTSALHPCSDANNHGPSGELRISWTCNFLSCQIV